MYVTLAVMPFFTNIQICGLTDKQTDRQAGKPAESQADRQTYVQKFRVQKDKVQKDIRHRGIETHRHTDGQTNKRTDRQVLYIL
jgi:hypothetical protein